MLERGLKIARWIGALAFLTMFAAFIVGVFMRYVAGQPIQWGDEFIIVLAIWIVFWVSAFVLGDHEHVRLDLLYKSFGAWGRRVVAFAAALLFGAIFLAALPGVIDYLMFLSRRHTDILEWRLSIVYLCLPMFFAAVVLRALVTIVRLASPSWRAYVADEAAQSEPTQAPK
jgi:TRAP-type C4-dicarboxylate transport system permease small subunit